MEEQWKTVIYNGEVFEQYEVSNYGNVRSLNYRGHGGIEILRPNNCGGYLKVVLRKNGKSRNFLVHRLVAIAFIPNPHNKPTVNHIDEDKTNNHVDNLEWMTQEEQVHHGTLQERKAKTQSKRVRCIETNVIYDSMKQASEETGLSKGNICSCCNGKLKTCGKLHWEYVD